jgi:hypothetical protein
MTKSSAISKAENQFSAIRKKELKSLKAKEKDRLSKAEHVAKLKALRLAKEAAEED